eukprot:SM000112S23995  [mRNA]  locus=s112:219365:221951:- [translate_table: standard]
MEEAAATAGGEPCPDDFAGLFADETAPGAAFPAHRVPASPGDYATAAYWARRYAGEPDVTYDWYDVSYAEFHMGYLAGELATGACTLLEIGCGNSAWSSAMAQSGFHVLSTDISSTVLRSRASQGQHSSLDQAVMDASNLQLRGCCCDVVVDKGTLDALLCQSKALSSEDLDSSNAGPPLHLQASAWPCNNASAQDQPPPFPITTCQSQRRDALSETSIRFRATCQSGQKTVSSFSWADEDFEQPLQGLLLCVGGSRSGILPAVATSVHRVLVENGCWLIVTTKRPAEMLPRLGVLTQVSHGQPAFLISVCHVLAGSHVLCLRKLCTTLSCSNHTRYDYDESPSMQIGDGFNGSIGDACEVERWWSRFTDIDIK